MEEKKLSTSDKKPIKRGRPRKKASGLGDTIEKITSATGIKAAVDWFSDATGVDCGCDARKEKLNKLFPYKKTECLTREEYDFIASLEGKSVVRASDQQVLNTAYNRIFNDKVVATSCGSCLKGRISQLLSVQKAYEGE